MSFLTSVILLTITFLLYVYWRFNKSREFFKKNAIPYLKPTIFVGNVTDALFKPKSIPILHLEMYRKLESHRFGGFFNFHSPFVMVRDPELIKHIMIKDFAHFSDRGMNVNIQLDGLSHHFLSIKGDEWKNLKVKLTSNFTGIKMKSMFPLIKESGNKLVQALETMTEKSFDVKDLCARFMTDVISTCAFGIEIQSLDNLDSRVGKMEDGIFQFRYKELIMNAYPNPPPSLMKFFNLRFMREKVDKFFTSTAENTVANNGLNNKTGRDFIDLFLSLKNAYQENQDLDHSFLQIKYQENQSPDQTPLQIAGTQYTNKIDMAADKLAAQCYIFFRAGFESTSTALGLLLLELAMHHDIQNKLRLEINSVMTNNSEGFTYEMLKQMPYVDMVLSEILRKYPASGYVVRKCTMDYKIPNTKNAIIPKTTQVIIPILGFHRDAKYYEKPDDFYPEHFTEEAKANRPNHTYLPFGAGPTACLGERFAKMQMKIGLISMLRNFSFELSPKTVLPVQFQRHFKVLKAEGGIWLRCKKI